MQILVKSQYYAFCINKPSAYGTVNVMQDNAESDGTVRFDDVAMNART